MRDVFGLGFCVGNIQGSFIKGRIVNFQRIPASKEGEAYCLLQALNWIQGEGFSSITIELDCKPAIDGILDTNFHHNELGSTLENCKGIIDHHTNFTISLTKR